MAEIVTIPDSLHDDQLAPHDDTTNAEHQNSVGQAESPKAPNGDLNLEELAPAHDGLATEGTSEQEPVKVINPKAVVEVKKSGSTSAVPPKKANGGPPTPTVKKIINSGTFGSGSVKAKPTAPVSSAAPKATGPAIRKTVTVTPPTSKLASTLSSKSSVPPATTIRRASVAPTKSAVAPPVRSSLSASTNARPSDDAPVRSIVASPTGSIASASAKGASAVPAARPRASVSEAVKKTPPTLRPSVASSAKAPVTARTSTVSRSSVAPPTKSTRPTGSISSIREVKEDSKALEELRAELADATESIESKNVHILELESQIETFKETFDNKLKELESRDASILESEQARQTAELQLKKYQDRLDDVQKQLQDLTTAMDAANQRLEVADSTISSQTSLINILEAKVQELKDNITTYQGKVADLEQTNALSVTTASEAASVEHEALLTAQANLKAISEEVDALKIVHTKAMQESEIQITELRDQLAATESLHTQVALLKAEKEDNANKISELEIEILESKETLEGLEDARDALQKQITLLETELAKSAVAVAAADEIAKQKDASHAQELALLVEQHQAEVVASSQRCNDIEKSLQDLKSDLFAAVAAKEQAEKDILEREASHTAKTVELQESHAAQQASLNADIERISEELKNQESFYNSKVEVVKSEHAQLLQEAFERAKDEAAKAHSEELRIFRSNADATVLQLQQANQESVDNLKSEHQSLMETEVNALQKQISTLNLELKATQDDLIKAKSVVEASNAEIESLTQQRDIARSQLEAAPSLSPEHANEITRLTKELSNTKDDLAAMTDMLNLTKSSMSELSDNHARELEQAAKGRADEVLKLREAHDVEVNTLAKQKSDLVVKLSDLEGELATAKASLEARQTSSPKSTSNGSIPASTSGITKEELIKMHEAHNLKVYDLQAEHEKAMKLARDEVESALIKMGELQQDIARKAMEIQYLEQEQEESAEQITRGVLAGTDDEYRLKEDLERLGQIEPKS